MKHAANRRRGVSTRAFVALLALVLVIGCVAGGTIAWLTTNTGTVTNTFTYGDIGIELTEDAGKNNGYNFKIIPGVNIKKDPKVTVMANSEDCWLFVKVEETNWPTFTEEGTTTKKVSWAIANGWTLVPGQTNVYCREAAAGQSFPVLKDNVVTVSQNLTKAEVNTVVALQPQLKFTAYAVQKDGIDTAAAAWEKAVPPTTTP